MDRSVTYRSPGVRSPWMIVGAVAILLAIVLTMAVHDIHRDKRNMSRILSEKGAALIKAFEAGAGTGMAGMMWSGSQVQLLLEQTARKSGILYLMVTDTSGKILAHDNRSLIGKYYFHAKDLKTLAPGKTERWRMVTLPGNRRAFEVYRYFQPLADLDPAVKNGMPRSACRMTGPDGESETWCFPPAQASGASGQRIIFVGLDPTPIEEAAAHDFRNTVILSAILLIAGIGGFLSLMWAEKYRITRSRLQDTSAFADEVVTHLPVGLVATDAGGQIAFFNGAAESITGLAFDRVRGKRLDAVMPLQWCGLHQVLSDGGIVLEREMECSFALPTTVPVSVSAARIHNASGAFVGDVLILRDLGEVRRLQQEIRRKEKLAALGEMAAGVAHEIRNPLSSIKGLATYFRGVFAEASDDREAADVMVQEVDRLNRAVTALLEFARPAELNRRDTDINDLLQHSVRLIQPDAAAGGITVDLAPLPNGHRARIDPDRLSQCLLNLYLNAIQAMDPGGRLSVSGDITGGTLRLRVADTGGGIGQGDLEKIFNPYFTTKSKGTGLGLAIVHKIIEAHAGRITVQSEPDAGTEFVIAIPVSRGPL